MAVSNLGLGWSGGVETIVRIFVVILNLSTHPPQDSRAMESVHKTSDYDSSIFKSPTPTNS
jgi:hypothetical protein